MEYGCVYSFVGRRNTTAEATAAAAAHLGVTTYMFFSYSYTLLFWGCYTTTSTIILISQKTSRTTRYEEAFFSLENQETKMARFARAPHNNMVFTGPTIYFEVYIILRFYGPYDTYVLQFFCSLFERSEFLIDTSQKKNPSACARVPRARVHVCNNLGFSVWYYVPHTKRLSWF